MPEWLKGADCKFAGESLHWFESSPAQLLVDRFVRAFGMFARLRERGRLVGRHCAEECLRSSGVERSLGKGEVMSSNLIGGS